MLDSSTLELLYTGLLCLGLLATWGLSGLLLPWSEAELDEIDDSLRALGNFFAGLRAAPNPMPRR